MSAHPPMTESEFHQRVDAILDAIEAVFDGVEADVDSERNGGVLTLTFENDSKVIVNRQTPNREIWVAAKSGGFHFRFDRERDCWVNTRSTETLSENLTRVVSEQAENVIYVTI
jgi:CyaY protein